MFGTYPALGELTDSFDPISLLPDVISRSSNSFRSCGFTDSEFSCECFPPLTYHTPYSPSSSVDLSKNTRPGCCCCCYYSLSVPLPYPICHHLPASFTPPPPNPPLVLFPTTSSIVDLRHQRFLVPNLKSEVGQVASRSLHPSCTGSLSLPSLICFGVFGAASLAARPRSHLVPADGSHHYRHPKPSLPG